MNRPLTNQQRAVYEYIRGKIVDRGYGPTVREIGEHMNIKSPNGVVCHLRALERKGMIHRTANKSRAIELVEPVNGRALGNLPVKGDIARGAVTPALMASNHSIDVGELSGSRRYAVMVRDNSLIGMHVAMGDYLIVDERNVCDVGQFVLVEPGTNATIICSCCREHSRLRLNPLSPLLVRSHFYVEEVKVTGVVIGIVRLLHH